MIDEKPQERHSPLPSHTPESSGNKGLDKTHSERWLDPDVGREVLTPPAEGQRH